LERVKILYQVSSTHYKSEGVFNTLLYIKREEGMKALFRGNLATVARIFPYAAVQFCAYEQFSKMFKTLNKGGAMSPIQHVMAGSSAGAISVLCTYPLDLARARLAVEVHQHPSLSRSLSQTYGNGGITALFRGITPTILGIIPYAGITFSSFDTLKKLVPSSGRNEKGEILIPAKLVCGGLAGAMGQTVAYPLDVVRRRMQTAGHASIPAIDPSLNFFQLTVNIIQKEGWKALFKGLSINYLKVAPAVSISFTTYEYVSSQLQRIS